MSATTASTTVTVSSSPGQCPRYQRPFDVIGALMLLLVLGLPAAIVALVVRLASPGPVLFRQERVGLNGRRFVMYKFRTMYHGADQEVHRAYFEQYRKGLAAPEEHDGVFKLRRDPRITPFGSLLRRLGLDEIPQLLNVIKGDMSLVGPRPPIPYEVELYSEHDRTRLTVKPGVTGLWQVRGRDGVDFDTMVALDLEYIRRQSLRLDLAIVLATFPALVLSSLKR